MYWMVKPFVKICVIPEADTRCVLLGSCQACVKEKGFNDRRHLPGKDFPYDFSKNVYLECEYGHRSLCHKKDLKVMKFCGRRGCNFLLRTEQKKKKPEKKKAKRSKYAESDDDDDNWQE
jgi:hypothetical protein